MLSMLMRHRFSNVNRRQQHKDVGLNQRDADVQQQEDHGNGNGKQGDENKH